MTPVILASTSLYRRQLLEKLGVPFTTQKPVYDEDFFKAEALKENKKPLAVAEMLSRGKAQSLAETTNGKSLIIAGDQLVDFQGEILGKAKNFEKAYAQLSRMRGKTHELVTAVTLMGPQGTHHFNHITRLKMKNLSDEEIQGYLKKDEPFDCAGSYKIEMSGLVLFSEILCDDFSAIQGLPLLWLSQKMKEMGYEFFKNEVK